LPIDLKGVEVPQNREQLAEQRIRVRAILISIFAGAGILGLKWYAFTITGSPALQSDAMESIINVVAAIFALGAVLFAGKPADRNHPYGHGKIEYFSAAFEGGLISLAAVLILFEALRALIQGVEVQSLSTGLAINFGAGLLNGGLGLFLIREGKRTGSRALEADGHHVISDFVTSLGLGAGLLLVWLTGWKWLDPVLALGVGVLLGFTGFKLVRSAAMALLDEEDPIVVKRLVESVSASRPEDVIAMHELRTLRAGRYHHVDVHLVVPEFYTVRQAHELVETYSNQVIQSLNIEGEFHSHIDPCHQFFCGRCGVSPCPLRKQEFQGRHLISIEEATQGPPPGFETDPV
jgi:cation diffusion facilitator family transporter